MKIRNSDQFKENWCQHVRMKTSVLCLKGPTLNKLASITDSQSDFSVCPGWSLELFTECDQPDMGPDKKILTNLDSICSHVCPPVSGITWFIGWVCISTGRSIPANFMQMKPLTPTLSACLTLSSPAGAPWGDSAHFLH